MDIQWEEKVNGNMQVVEGVCEWVQFGTTWYILGNKYRQDTSMCWYFGGFFAECHGRDAMYHGDVNSHIAAACDGDLKPTTV